jgi:hypothetical protein
MDVADAGSFVTYAQPRIERLRDIDMAEIKLGLSMFRMGYHIAAWRHPDVQADGSMDFRHFLSVTTAAERGKFDLVFMADELAIRGRDNPPGALVRQSNGAELEPITLLAALAPMTRHIGLVATGSTTYSEPFNLARQFLSLDHLSGGRAGWNVVTSWGAEDALNFGHVSLPDYALRYERWCAGCGAAGKWTLSCAIRSRGSITTPTGAMCSTTRANTFRCRARCTWRARRRTSR